MVAGSLDPKIEHAGGLMLHILPPDKQTGSTRLVGTKGPRGSLSPFIILEGGSKNCLFGADRRRQSE